MFSYDLSALFSPVVLGDFALQSVSFFNFFLVVTALGGALVVTLNDVRYALRGASFDAKCALQITQSTCLIALFSWVSFIVLALLMAPPEAHWNFIKAVLPYLGREIILPTGVTSLLYLNLIFRSLFKKHYILHLFIGILSSLSSVILFIWCQTKVFQEYTPHLILTAWYTSFEQMLFVALDTLHSPEFYLGLSHIMLIGIASASAFSMVWMMLRRNKADYGRDYYSYSLRYCANVALFSSIAACLVSGSILWALHEVLLPELSQEQSFWVYSVIYALPLLACAFWFRIITSVTPMRYKLSMVFALVLLFFTLIGQVLASMDAMPMP